MQRSDSVREEVFDGPNHQDAILYKLSDVPASKVDNDSTTDISDWSTPSNVRPYHDRNLNSRNDSSLSADSGYSSGDSLNLLSRSSPRGSHGSWKLGVSPRNTVEAGLSCSMQKTCSTVYEEIAKTGSAGKEQCVEPQLLETDAEVQVVGSIEATCGSLLPGADGIEATVGSMLSGEDGIEATGGSMLSGADGIEATVCSMLSREDGIENTGGSMLSGADGIGATKKFAVQQKSNRMLSILTESLPASPADAGSPCSSTTTSESAAGFAAITESSAASMTTPIGASIIASMQSAAAATLGPSEQAGNGESSLSMCPLPQTEVCNFPGTREKCPIGASECGSFDFPTTSVSLSESLRRWQNSKDKIVKRTAAYKQLESPSSEKQMKRLEGFEGAIDGGALKSSNRFPMSGNLMGPTSDPAGDVSKDCLSSLLADAYSESALTLPRDHSFENSLSNGGPVLPNSNSFSNGVMVGSLVSEDSSPTQGDADGIGRGPFQEGSLQESHANQTLNVVMDALDDSDEEVDVELQKSMKKIIDRTLTTIEPKRRFSEKLNGFYHRKNPMLVRGSLSDSADRGNIILERGSLMADRNATNSLLPSNRGNPAISTSISRGSSTAMEDEFFAHLASEKSQQRNRKSSSSTSISNNNSSVCTRVDGNRSNVTTCSTDRASSLISSSFTTRYSAQISSVSNDFNSSAGMPVVNKEHACLSHQLSIVSSMMSDEDENSDENPFEGLSRAVSQNNDQGGGLARSDSFTHSEAGGIDRRISTGLDRGFSTGLDRGMSTGLGRGVNIGLERGMGTGLDRGVSTGLDLGMSTGLDRGMSTGLDPSVSTGFECGCTAGPDPARSLNRSDQGVALDVGLERSESGLDRSGGMQKANSIGNVVSADNPLISDPLEVVMAFSPPWESTSASSSSSTLPAVVGSSSIRTGTPSAVSPSSKLQNSSTPISTLHQVACAGGAQSNSGQHGSPCRHDLIISVPPSPSAGEGVLSPPKATPENAAWRTLSMITEEQEVEQYSNEIDLIVLMQATQHEQAAENAFEAEQREFDQVDFPETITDIGLIQQSLKDLRDLSSNFDSKDCLSRAPTSCTDDLMYDSKTGDMLNSCNSKIQRRNSLNIQRAASDKCDKRPPLTASDCDKRPPLTCDKALDGADKRRKSASKPLGNDVECSLVGSFPGSEIISDTMSAPAVIQDKVSQRPSGSQTSSTRFSARFESLASSSDTVISSDVLLSNPNDMISSSKPTARISVQSHVDFDDPDFYVEGENVDHILDDKSFTFMDQESSMHADIARGFNQNRKSRLRKVKMPAFPMKEEQLDLSRKSTLNFGSKSISPRLVDSLNDSLHSSLSRSGASSSNNPDKKQEGASLEHRVMRPNRSSLLAASEALRKTPPLGGSSPDVPLRRTSSSHSIGRRGKGLEGSAKNLTAAIAGTKSDSESADDEKERTKKEYMSSPNQKQKLWQRRVIAHMHVAVSNVILTCDTAEAARKEFAKLSSMQLNFRKFKRYIGDKLQAADLFRYILYSYKNPNQRKIQQLTALLDDGRIELPLHARCRDDLAYGSPCKAGMQSPSSSPSSPTREESNKDDEDGNSSLNTLYSFGQNLFMESLYILSDENEEISAIRRRANMKQHDILNEDRIKQEFLQRLLDTLKKQLSEKHGTIRYKAAMVFDIAKNPKKEKEKTTAERDKLQLSQMLKHFFQKKKVPEDLLEQLETAFPATEAFQMVDVSGFSRAASFEMHISGSHPASLSKLQSRNPTEELFNDILCSEEEPQYADPTNGNTCSNLVGTDHSTSMLMAPDLSPSGFSPCGSAGLVTPPGLPALLAPDNDGLVTSCPGFSSTSGSLPNSDVGFCSSDKTTRIATKKSNLINLDWIQMAKHMLDSSNRIVLTVENCILPAVQKCAENGEFEVATFLLTKFRRVRNNDFLRGRRDNKKRKASNCSALTRGSSKRGDRKTEKRVVTKTDKSGGASTCEQADMNSVPSSAPVGGFVERFGRSDSGGSVDADLQGSASAGESVLDKRQTSLDSSSSKNSLEESRDSIDFSSTRQSLGLLSRLFPGDIGPMLPFLWVADSQFSEWEKAAVVEHFGSFSGHTKFTEFCSKKCSVTEEKEMMSFIRAAIIVDTVVLNQNFVRNKRNVLVPRKRTPGFMEIDPLNISDNMSGSLDDGSSSHPTTVEAELQGKIMNFFLSVIEENLGGGSISRTNSSENSGDMKNSNGSVVEAGYGELPGSLSAASSYLVKQVQGSSTDSTTSETDGSQATFSSAFFGSSPRRFSSNCSSLCFLLAESDKRQRRPPLMWASLKNPWGFEKIIESVDMFCTLIDDKTDSIARHIIDRRDQKGRPTFTLAAREGLKDVLKLLLEFRSGAFIPLFYTSRDNESQTAMCPKTKPNTLQWIKAIAKATVNKKR